MKRPKSTTEEMLCALYLIAAIQAQEAGIWWLAFLCGLKACLDFWCALKAAWRECLEE
jgi:hypothetical protein